MEFKLGFCLNANVKKNWPNIHVYRILGECLLMSSLPGEALIMLVDIGRLAERFNKPSQSRVR